MRGFFDYLVCGACGYSFAYMLNNCEMNGLVIVLMAVSLFTALYIIFLRDFITYIRNKRKGK